MRVAPSARARCRRGGIARRGGRRSAKNQPSTIYVDQSGGYRITVPKTWQIVKPSVAAVKQTIAQLKKQKKTRARDGLLGHDQHRRGRKEL